MSVPDSAEGVSTDGGNLGRWGRGETMSPTPTHLLVETGRASRVTVCDEPFSNGQFGTEDRADVTCEVCLDRSKVRTFNHSRKGRLTGVVVSVTGEWTYLRLVGDHNRDRMYSGNDGRHTGIAGDGETLTVRTSFLTEVTDV